MTILLVSIAILGAVAALFGLFQGGGAHRAPENGGCSTCSSAAGCGGACAAAPDAGPAEYFDDEELDRYSGRPSDGYTDEEAAEFAEVMYTLPAGEAPLWAASLGKRGIGIPNQIKDELIMFISDPQ